MNAPSMRTASHHAGRTGTRGRTHRSTRLLIIAGVVVMVVTSTLVWWSSRAQGPGLAAEATVTSSSTALGFSARDAVASGSAASPGGGWRSDRETVGAWIDLFWPEAHVLHQIVLVRNPLQEPGVTDGFLTLGDGSFVQVRLSTTSRETVIPISPRSVDRVRFTASAAGAGAQNVSVDEIVVNDRSSDGDVVTDSAPAGNAAGAATATQNADGAADPRLLQDGSGAPGTAGVGAVWTADQPVDTWVQLQWDRPRELTSIEVVGSERSSSTLSRATLAFGDGARLPVGAVLADPARPTIISFMPRVTTSIRLIIDGVDGTGQLALGELRAHQRTVTPVRPPSAAPVGAPLPDSTGCDLSTAGTAESGLLVHCPVTGDMVDEKVTFQLSAGPGYSSVTAAVWTADPAARDRSRVSVTPDASGVAELTVDVGSAPPGPLTVAFEATGPGLSIRTVFFQLYRRADGPAADLPSSAPAAGRTMAFAEEFSQPLSLSRTGADADYAAAKPTHDGAEDFGDAGFADPARGVDNVKVVDNRYLRIDVTPSPAGYGSGSHLGGLLASARQGGSGFSAQYGYFEARMLAPAAPGTWPAFWMLPSDNLVAPQPAVAEIDAVELYGHDPRSACHSTHEYVNGRDGGVSRCGQRFGSDREALAWHTYGVSIVPTGITFYIDGQIVATTPQVKGGDAPMFFLLNLALGGGWPVDLRAVQDRATLYVDYVRVYV